MDTSSSATNTARTNAGQLEAALPFWAALSLVPVVWLAAVYGGTALLLVPLMTWGLFTLIDALIGLNTSNPDPDTPDSDLFWHRLITLIWAPMQAMTVFGAIAYAVRTGHLANWELFVLAFGLGTLNGSVGIVFAHELMHQKSRLERWLGDILMGMALYGHFRSEHLLVHHRYVGTPRDAVTARYGQGFYNFFVSVLHKSLRSSLKAEAELLRRKELSPWHISNPFWRYAALSVATLLLAYVAGGTTGVWIYLVVAGTAIAQLELVNYVEHYGLTRRYLGNGKYEPTRPHHSWNAAHRASNWLLINLQRHSDHHTKPSRRYPLLQTHKASEAPQLPFGYPIMTLMALVPPLWRRRMNPRIKAWRARFYPDISDWSDYSSHKTPMPR